MVGTVFATTLQALRKKRGVTQEQLAAYLGVSPQAVSKWENGSFQDGDLLPGIADFFAFLGKQENLEVLFYLLSLRNGECVSVSSLCWREQRNF